jgi:hypothetical protein
MRKFLIGSVLTAAFLAAPLAAQTADQPATRDADYRDNDDDAGKWGLAGLLGLVGLMGLKRREEPVHRSTTVREGAATSAR